MFICSWPGPLRDDPEAQGRESQLNILALLLVEAGKPPLAQLEVTDVALHLPTGIMNSAVEEIFNPGQRLPQIVQEVIA